MLLKEQVSRTLIMFLEETKHKSPFCLPHNMALLLNALIAHTNEDISNSSTLAKLLSENFSNF